ncbi:MAG TPA: hypothetical protein VJK02_00880 [Anaerolineales bacterium]|nr:hypothetical protein [Anaerolineales bacterium]
MEGIHREDLVLVAVLNARRDLEIARVLGWYRIPLASAPKTMRVDWLAFYLTGAFGEERWSIRYVCPVRGYELTTRRALLRDQTDHLRADEPYFKLQLGTMRQLARPIVSARWRRFTFLYTTGDRLLAATEIKELTVPHSNDRDRLWRILREHLAPDSS